MGEERGMEQGRGEGGGECVWGIDGVCVCVCLSV